MRLVWSCENLEVIWLIICATRSKAMGIYDASVGATHARETRAKPK